MNTRWFAAVAVLAVLLVVCACSTPNPVPTPVDNPSPPPVVPAPEEADNPAEEPKDEPPEKDPDVVFVPTPQDVVDLMLHLAKVEKDDVLYDLGCGDGRVVATAAKRYGCRAIGYDVDPERVRESRENIRRNQVGKLARIEQKDIFKIDLSPATVVFLYLLPDLNVRLIPQLEKLKPGTRIISHDFDMEGIRPDIKLTMFCQEDNAEHEVYLWTTPLQRVAAAEEEEMEEDPDEDPDDDLLGRASPPLLPWELERGARPARTR